jgi:hypothetical protein
MTIWLDTKSKVPKPTDIVVCREPGTAAAPM